MKSSQKKGKIIRIIIAFIVLAALITALYFALTGKFTTSGSFPAAIKTESLVCTASKVPYEKLNKDSSADSNVKIIGLFNAQGTLMRLSLDYSVHYPNHDSAVMGEATAHVALSEHLKEDELSFTEFDNKFTTYKNKSTLSLFIDADKLTKNNASYFLLKDYDHDSSTLPTISELEPVYKKQGFECTSTASE